MQDLLKYIPLLKIGTSKEYYPLHAQYIYFDRDTIRTCNNEIYIKLKYDSEVSGCLNLFVLEDVLKTVSKHTNTIFEVMEDKVVVKSDQGYTATLNIEPILFPEKERPEYNDPVQVTDSLLTILNDAIQFTSSKSLAMYTYIVLSDNYILAAGGDRCFISKTDKMQVNNNIGINKKILSVLDRSCTIYSDKGNTVVSFGDQGYAVFTTDILTSFPVGKMIEFVGNYKDGALLCEMGILNEALDSLLSVFHGDKMRMCTLSNTNKLLTLKSESIYGETKTFINTALVEDYKITLSIDLLKNLPANYNVYVFPEEVGIFHLRNEYGDILVKDMSIV